MLAIFGVIGGIQSDGFWLQEVYNLDEKAKYKKYI